MRAGVSARWRVRSARDWVAPPRALRMLAGALVTIASALAAIVAGTAGFVVVVAALAIWAVARVATRDSDRQWLPAAVVAIFGLRVIGVISLHLILVGRGTAGALFLDDAGYVTLAATLSRFWGGVAGPVEVLSSGLYDPSIGNLYVRAAAGLFWLVGENVVALKIVNSALAVLTALAVYRTVLNIGSVGARLAIAIVLVSPSLALWSALALKDAYAIAFSAAAVWTVSEIVRGGRIAPWLALTIVTLLALQDVRRYMFLLLCLLLPVGLFFALRGRRRVSATIASALISIVLIVATPAAELLNPDVFSWTAFVRGQMAAGARSAFVQPLPIVQASPGQPFVVVVPGQSVEPNRTPRIVQVQAGTVLVPHVPNVTPTMAPGTTSMEVVRPGDIVVVATPAPVSNTKPSATPAPVDLEISKDRINIVATPGPGPAGRGTEGFTFIQGLEANVRHLPTGALFLLLAPFPPLARTAGELAATPDMLLWYVIWPFAAIGLVRVYRERRYAYAYGALMLCAVAFVLVLAEGNVGTLVRHRTMLLPFIAPLVALGLAGVRQIPKQLLD